MTEFKDVQIAGSVLVWIIGFCIFITHFIAHILARQRLHRNFKQSFDKEPSVSIIKPLCFPNNTVDDFLENNLESFFKQKYTNFDISFCVGDSQDASIDIVNSLISRYPNVNARLFIGQEKPKPNEKRVTNPKLNNIKVAYESSESEYIWICDSRIHVDDENTLAEMVSHFENGNIGLVHSVPVSISRTDNSNRK